MFDNIKHKKAKAVGFKWQLPYRTRFLGMSNGLS